MCFAVCLKTSMFIAIEEENYEIEKALWDLADDGIAS